MSGNIKLNTSADRLIWPIYIAKTLIQMSDHIYKHINTKGYIDHQLFTRILKTTWRNHFIIYATIDTTYIVLSKTLLRSNTI